MQKINTLLQNPVTSHDKHLLFLLIQTRQEMEHKSQEYNELTT